MGKYVLVLDQGSIRSRCVLFDKNGEIIGVGERKTNPIYPKPEWVELNLWKYGQANLQQLQK